MILDEELTSYFEQKMNDIRENTSTPDEVLQEARDKLTNILNGFKEKEKEIGLELAAALKKTRDKQTHVGKCPSCEGELMIKRGKFGYFIACSRYPECKTTFKLPKGKFKVLEKTCTECGFPTIQISRGKRPQIVCINDNCPSKTSEEIEHEKHEIENGHIEKKCPKCGEALILRKSIYGQFLGCSKFPKCRYTEKLDNGKN